MKKNDWILIALLLVGLALFATRESCSQVWFQASIEHKLNRTAGLSISNEIGYNFETPGAIMSPSVDYTYFSDGEKTQTLLFQCLTFTYFPFGISSVTPYGSLTISHLDTFPVHAEAFGGSVQIGIGFELSKHAQFFSQYRYFQYQNKFLEGHLTQFGIMYTFGG